MVLPFNKYTIWCLYMLSVVYHTVVVLSETNSSTLLLNNKTIDFNYGELAEYGISGIMLKNATANRGRSLKCVPMIKYFEVHLNEPVRPKEKVGLTGDHIQLGEWQIDKSLEMKKRRRNALIWYLKVPMCSALRIYYRFFVYYEDEQGFKHIRHWESQQHARVIEAYEMFRIRETQKFGYAHALAVGGGIQQEKSWLRKQYILQLKFIWPQHISFTKFSHFIRTPKYILKLKIYPNDNTETFSKKSNLEENIEVQVSRFVDKHSKLKTLTEQGEIYQPGDIVIIHITAASDLDNFYILGIYTRQQELLGEVLIPPTVIEGSEGILELPIFEVKENSRVGWLTLPFLRVEALPEALKFNMRASFHHYWPFNWPTLDIGHRGVGKSFYHHAANAIENTIESFLMANEAKSDMVFLNVQLTKDYVPIVWHDFGFLTISSLKQRKISPKALSYVYIHDLTYQELLKMRVFIFIKGLLVEVTYLNTMFAANEQRIFAQLAQVYQKLPTTLGIMIGIKWPQLLSGGSFESLQSLNKNRYVDEILRTTMEFGCSRPLIMASFDADICTMLRFKQHMYPVVLLTLGQHSPWESYADLRTHSLARAIQFVQASDILGTAIYAKEITSEQTKEDLETTFELQQLVFVWGDQLTDFSLVDQLKNQEMAGLIYDHIDDLMLQKSKSKRKRFNFFQAQELQRIFIRQCIAAGNLSVSEGLPDTRFPYWPRFRTLDEL